MSTSEAGSPKFTLRLPPDTALRIVVRDARLNTVQAFDGGASDLQLKRGLYSVRIEGPHGMSEKDIRLDRDIDLRSEGPRRFSAAPIHGSELSHEYYEGPSAQYSRTYTRPPLDAAHDSALFIFLRAVDREGAGDLAGGHSLTLHRSNGEPVARFDGSDAEHGASDGWIAFSAEAAAGFYRLRVGGAEPRELGIHLFPGWQTQVFVISTGGTPILAGARFFLARLGTGFHAGDEQLRLVDDAIAMLSAPSASPTRAMIANLLHQKVENPVLGLLGAWLLVREGRRDPEKVSEWGKNIDVVIGRLTDLIGSCADVRALRIAATMDPAWDSSWTMFNEPPMMAVGLRRVIAAARVKPWVFADSQLMEDICEKVISDSVWTTWESLIDEPQVPAAGPALAQTSARAPDQKSGRAPLGWVESSILNTIAQSVDSHSRRTSRSASPNPASELSDAAFARQLDITPRRVQQALSQLDMISPSDAERMLDVDVRGAVIGYLGKLASLVRKEPR